MIILRGSWPYPPLKVEFGPPPADASEVAARMKESQGEHTMPNIYILTGSVTDERTLTLDEVLPITAGKVRVTVEILPAESKPTLSETLERIHQGQRERGFRPPTREEVDAYLEAERDSWDD